MYPINVIHLAVYVQCEDRKGKKIILVMLFYTCKYLCEKNKKASSVFQNFPHILNKKRQVITNTINQVTHYSMYQLPQKTQSWTKQMNHLCNNSKYTTRLNIRVWVCQLSYHIFHRDNVQNLVWSTFQECKRRGYCKRPTFQVKLEIYFEKENVTGEKKINKYEILAQEWPTISNSHISNPLIGLS